MLFTDIIAKKRDGGALNAEEIGFLVDGLADASLPAEQVSALAMAIYLNGMSFGEAAQLTILMSQSGVVLDWSKEQLNGPVVDKHSTGGVGDKVSFMLAPIVAACGGYVPMISGRGLGHTGGTTDKVESIPGYQSMPDFDKFRKVVREVGCSIIGQTADLAPADKRFYAIRDVTSTVESIPLITASILAKKIAAGLGFLVMDVKVGSGAFMATLDQATKMATSIIGTAAEADLPAHALVTDMNQVLGRTAGNALEVREAVAFMRNDFRDSRLNEVTLGLCAEMLCLSGIEEQEDVALQKVDAAISSGAALEKFSAMVAAMDGPTDFVEKIDEYLPAADVVQPVFAEDDGFVSSIDTFAMGNAVIELGGGRKTLHEVLDLSAGLSNIAGIRDSVSNEEPLAVIHAATEEKAQAAAALIKSAVTISDTKPTRIQSIYQRITPE